LRNGGKTVVVLPQGILTYRGPALLFDAIQDGRAAVVSEFAPDMAWETHAAVTRNTTISAFSLLVCVIEPKKTGGSVRTARCALAQGKRVLVYPARGCASVVQSLSNGGALELVEGLLPVGLDELADLWRTACVHPREQETLL
jgi:predicted Rossmann fold nucleotide-binding protein DprA/Smf involved in DNA uptake